MSPNFQLKRLKLNLDIVEKPENRVHKLTDSNVSRSTRPQETIRSWNWSQEDAEYVREESKKETKELEGNPNDDLNNLITARQMAITLL